MADDELTMVRENLEDVPLFPLPDEYGFRWYEEGDVANWVALQAPFYEPGQISAEIFRRWFGWDEALLAERQCYLVDAAGVPIGTATAWVFDGFRGPEYGRVHWVAIAEEHQGLGLGKALMTHILLRMRELGHTLAYLTTSASRPAAVALYRQLGFRELS